MYPIALVEIKMNEKFLHRFSIRQVLLFYILVYSSPIHVWGYFSFLKKSKVF